jgi:hypothetical protein
MAGLAPGPFHGAVIGHFEEFAKPPHTPGQIAAHVFVANQEQRELRPAGLEALDGLALLQPVASSCRELGARQFAVLDIGKTKPPTIADQVNDLQPYIRSTREQMRAANGFDAVHVDLSLAQRRLFSMNRMWAATKSRSCRRQAGISERR